MKTFDVTTMRHLDQIAIEEKGITAEKLMERAGNGAAVNEHERWPEIEHCKWPGNEHFGGQDAVERSMVGKRQSNFEIVIC